MHHQRICVSIKVFKYIKQVVRGSVTTCFWTEIGCLVDEIGKNA